MGRHAAPVQFDGPTRQRPFDDAHPTTDPLLLPTQLIRSQPRQQPRTSTSVVPFAAPIVVPQEEHAAADAVVQHRRATTARPLAPVPAPLPIASAPRSAVRAFTDQPFGLAPRIGAVGLTTAPIPARLHTGAVTTAFSLGTEEDEDEDERLPRWLSPRRTAVLAACAVAVLGAVSTAAAILPSTEASASSGQRCVDLTAQPRPTAKPVRVGHKAWRLRHRAPVAGAGASTSVSTAPAGTPSASSSSSPSASSSSSPSTTPTSSGSTSPGTSVPAPSGIVSGVSAALASVLGGLGNSVAALGTGTFSFSNFTVNNLIGFNLGHAGINGAGIDKTIIEMTPHTSTRQGLVPTAQGTTNNLSLLQVTGTPHLSNFTLRGTEQGHLYNGLRVGQATDARVSNVKVTAVPGNNHMPPGETFGINDWRTTGSVYTGVEVDGGGVGAAGFGANNSSDITIRDSYFHDNPYSIGATFWQSNGITLEDVRSTGNRGGLNFERVSGTVNIVRPVLGDNSDSDLSFGSDQGSAKVTIVDPKIVDGSKLRIRIYGSYNGPNRQLRSDIRVIVNGVDRTAELVKWI